VKSKRFKDLSPRGKILTSVVAAISLVIIGFAQSDIQHRDESEIRGGKLPWRLVSLNALGALGYLVWGRRPAGD
jgi:hypothetical protein